MEIRQSVQRVPTRPIALVMAILSLVAVALTTWYALASGPASQHPATERTYAAPLVNYGPLGPDAQTRDLEQRLARERDDTSHGH